MCFFLDDRGKTTTRGFGENRFTSAVRTSDQVRDRLERALGDVTAGHGFERALNGPTARDRSAFAPNHGTDAAPGAGAAPSACFPRSSGCSL